jgi:hypothetical protein
MNAAKETFLLSKKYFTLIISKFGLIDLEISGRRLIWVGCRLQPFSLYTCSIEK